MVLVQGAGSEQLREARPYLEEAGVFLLGCGSCDWAGRKISKGDLAKLAPKVMEDIKNRQTLVSAVLTGWWAERSEAAARAIVRAARESLGPPDQRFVSVVLDPRLLGRAIRRQTLGAFLDLLERSGTLSAQTLTACRQAVKAAYDPDPEPQRPVRRGEDPEAFLELMRRLAARGPVAGAEEPIRRSDKLLGAWRDISGVRHLVMPEESWKRVYAKEARGTEGLDVSFLKKEGWERALQKLLAEAGYIKAPSAGFRYRFDLYGDGSRDKTYVVAIPQAILER